MLTIWLRPPLGGVMPANPALDFFSVLASGHANIVIRLKVQPRFRRHAETGSEAQRRVRGNRALAIDDQADAIGRDIQIPRQTINAEAHGFQKILAQNLARMDGFQLFGVHFNSYFFGAGHFSIFFRIDSAFFATGASSRYFS